MSVEPNPISWTQETVTDLKGLFKRSPESTYRLPHEMKKGPIDKIAMRPSLSESDQLRLDHLYVIALRGFEPRSDG